MTPLSEHPALDLTTIDLDKGKQEGAPKPNFDSYPSDTASEVIASFETLSKKPPLEQVKILEQSVLESDNPADQADILTWGITYSTVLLATDRSELDQVLIQLRALLNFVTTKVEPGLETDDKTLSVRSLLAAAQIQLCVEGHDFITALAIIDSFEVPRDIVMYLPQADYIFQTNALVNLTKVLRRFSRHQDINDLLARCDFAADHVYYPMMGRRAVVWESALAQSDQTVIQTCLKPVLQPPDPAEQRILNIRRLEYLQTLPVGDPVYEALKSTVEANQSAEAEEWRWNIRFYELKQASNPTIEEVSQIIAGFETLGITFHACEVAFWAASNVRINLSPTEKKSLICQYWRRYEQITGVNLMDILFRSIGSTMQVSQVRQQIHQVDPSLQMQPSSEFDLAQWPLELQWLIRAVVDLFAQDEDNVSDLAKRLQSASDKYHLKQKRTRRTELVENHDEAGDYTTWLEDNFEGARHRKVTVSEAFKHKILGTNLGSEILSVLANNKAAILNHQFDDIFKPQQAYAQIVILPLSEDSVEIIQVSSPHLKISPSEGDLIARYYNTSLENAEALKFPRFHKTVKLSGTEANEHIGDLFRPSYISSFGVDLSREGFLPQANVFVTTGVMGDVLGGAMSIDYQSGSKNFGLSGYPTEAIFEAKIKTAAAQLHPEKLSDAVLGEVVNSGVFVADPEAGAGVMPEIIKHIADDALARGKRYTLVVMHPAIKRNYDKIGMRYAVLETDGVQMLNAEGRYKRLIELGFDATNALHYRNNYFKYDLIAVLIDNQQVSDILTRAR